MEINDRMAKDWLTAKAEFKKAKAKFESEKHRLIKAIGKRMVVYTPKYVISFSIVPRTLVDVDLLRLELPEVAEKFSRPSEAKTLSITKR